jgi:serine/threonine protein kinase
VRPSPPPVSIPIPAPARRVGIDDFTRISMIGRGTYGKVMLVRKNDDKRLFAMKAMSKKMLQDYGQIEQTKTERNVLLQTVHPFLVGAHYTFQSETKLFLVLDYVPGGELFLRLKQEQRFSEQRSRLYAAEILLGLGHLHSLGFVYRDLKPENVLVDANGHLKLTDFGLVKTDLTGGMSTTSTFCGTPQYMAPEMVDHSPYTKAVDWWSFGVLLYEMLVGIPPFFNENRTRLYRSIKFDPIRFPDWTSDEAQDLLLKLLERNPNRRLGGGPRDHLDIMKQPFFADLDWDAVLARRIVPEWIPQIASATDTSNFEEEFTRDPVPKSLDDDEGEVVAPATQRAFEGFTYIAKSRL